MSISRLQARLSAATATVGTFLVLSVSSVHAAAPPPEIVPTGSVTGSFSIVNFLKNGVGTAINLIFFLAGAAAIIYLIWAGIKYITAGGDTKKAGEARTAIINAVIGIAVIIGAFTLINVAFGVNNVVNGIEDGEQTFQ
jgi:succinate dehydrogenase/fumarate reductase cytochrome b subunit